MEVSAFRRPRLPLLKDFIPCCIPQFPPQAPLLPRTPAKHDRSTATPTIRLNSTANQLRSSERVQLSALPCHVPLKPSKVLWAGVSLRFNPRGFQLYLGCVCKHECSFHGMAEPDTGSMATCGWSHTIDRSTRLANCPQEEAAMSVPWRLRER